MELINNLIYLFTLTNPTMSADKMYQVWNKNKVLREYKRPDIMTLRQIRITVIKEVGINLPN